jgi:glucose/mannose-6-phosphate isomerase
MDIFTKNILELPKQLNLRAVKTVNLGKLKNSHPDAVIVCGMGGSGLIGDILRATAGEIGLPVPVLTVKHESLPTTSFKRPLYVCISFSGETSETLDCLKAALRAKTKAGVTVVTGQGGEMRRIAEENGLPAAFFTPGHLTPRLASGYMYYGLTNILRGAFPRLTIRDLSKSIKTAGFAREGASLAKRLRGKNVLVYSDEAYAALGYIWKISLNETGKTAAFAGTYPEINHNEIVGFEGIKGPWHAVWLMDPALEKMTKSKVDFVIQALKCGGIESDKISLKGKTAEEKFWNGVILAEWTSLNVAKIKGLRPEETKEIDELKKRFR